MLARTDFWVDLFVNRNPRCNNNRFTSEGMTMLAALRARAADLASERIGHALLGRSARGS